MTDICMLCGDRGFCEWWDIGEKVAGWLCAGCERLKGPVRCYREIRSKYVLPENIGYRDPPDPDKPITIEWDCSFI